MKRILQLGAIVFALFLAFFVVGCTEVDPVITDVNIDASTNIKDIDILDFDLHDLILVVTYDDGSEERIQVTESMISTSDLNLLQYWGDHEITIMYEGFDIEITIELVDSASIEVLSTYYTYLSNVLGYQESYDQWIASLTNQGQLTIFKAEVNNQGNFILTLSNFQTLNLGQINLDTVTVTFYGKDGNVLDVIIILRGESATPPVAPSIPDFNFLGWDGMFTDVQTNTNVYAIYEPIGTPVSIDDADTLIISLDRLEHAQFNVNLDSIFSQTSSTASTHTYRSLSSIIRDATTMEADPFGPDYFIPHTYWSHMFYHKSLYEQPAIIDGYHVITQTLTSYSDHALNNLYEVTSQVTSQARERADWAVDYIAVVDLWVIEGDYKYLLHYDETLDRVELYTIWTYEALSITSYEKIYVFYNDRGEEVIESWIYQIYSNPEVGGYPGVMVYYNSVDGRDFNYYAVWLDESYEPTNMHHFRGINLNEEGYYEYYDNDMHMISGDYGWYTIQPYIYPNQETIVYTDTPNMTLYSPDASTNVVTFFKNYDQGYQVMLYLPAMQGVEALLVEEGGMYQTNQDSQNTQDMLTSYGFDLMPDWWEVNNQSIEIAKGIKTANGTYFAQYGTLTGAVTLQYVDVYIGSEGIREYDYYFNRYGVATLYIDVNTLDEAINELTTYLSSIGLSYKFGDTEQLFKEMGYVYENYETLGRDVSITNDSLWGPDAMYQDYSSYVNGIQTIINHLSIREELVAMELSYEEIAFEHMPPRSQLDALALINTQQALVGGLSLVNQKLSTDQVTATLKRSPLLQNDKNYSLFYGLLLGGRFIELGHETSQTYQGQDLVFDGDLTLDIPIDLMYGEYELVTFFAKVMDDGMIRVSSIISAPVNAFDDFSLFNINEENEQATEFKLFNLDGRVSIYVFDSDVFPPKIYFEEKEPFTSDYDRYEEHGLRGSITVNEFLVPENTTVGDLIEGTYTLDNQGQIPMKLTVDHFTKDGLAVTLSDVFTGTGWVIEVSDEAGNKTTVTIDHIRFGYVTTFIANGEVIDQVIAKSTEVITPPEAPEIVGYTFVSWGTEDFTSLEDRTLTAIYNPTLFTISWKYLEDIVATTEVPYGSEITDYEMSSIEGYYFQWQRYDVTMPANDLVIEGDYYKLTFTIFFYVNGELYQEVNVLFGETITYPVVEVDEGYHFSGWDPQYETMPAQSFYTYGLILPNVS